MSDCSEPPPGLERARTVARLLDSAVKLPGVPVRIGFDPLLSIIPVAGDVAGAVIGLYVVFEAYRAGVQRRILARMCVTLAADAALGAIPYVGPVFDAAIRPNDRNVTLFERAVESA